MTSPLHPSTAAILRFFSYNHLPEGRVRETSQMCAALDD